MVQVVKISEEQLKVNNKPVTVYEGKVVNDFDLTPEELKAANDFLKSIERLKIKSTIQ